MSFESSHSRWQAVTSRLRAADGHFVYAVKSTNIYCRPTCPARLARRANVDFYRLAGDAEAAGYRPCKRCKPENAGLEEDVQGEIVQRACGVLAGWARGGGGLSEEGGEGPRKGTEDRKMGLKELAAEVGKTPRYLHKIFKDRMGVTPRQYVEQMKELNNPITAMVAPQATIAMDGPGPAVVGGDMLWFDSDALDFDFEWDASFEPEQVGTAQTLGDGIFPDLVTEASFGLGIAPSMPMTPSDNPDDALSPNGTNPLIAHAQDLPALSPAALDAVLVDAMLSEYKLNDLLIGESAPDELAEWVWEAEWSNAVIDSYQRTAAVL